MTFNFRQMDLQTDKYTNENQFTKAEERQTEEMVLHSSLPNQCCNDNNKFFGKKTVQSPTLIHSFLTTCLDVCPLPQQLKNV